MKAIQAAVSGDGALHFVDIPDPQPQAGQALVRVTSAGVTPLDRFVLAGSLPSAKKPPLVLGNEGAGVVVEDPSGRLSAGERVLFFAGPGGVTRDGTFVARPRSILPARRGPRGIAPSHRRSTIRQGDPDRGRKFDERTPFLTGGRYYYQASSARRLHGGLR
jgi:hypothetical protein